jgi:hypothetical protein
MEMHGRYVVAQAKLADRYAEASRARLVKDDTLAEGRGVVITGGTPSVARLRARLAGLRGMVRRPANAAAASSAR